MTKLVEDRTDQELLDRVAKLERKVNGLEVSLIGSLIIVLISLAGIIAMYFLQ